MTPNRARKKPEAGAPGLKVLITAASLAATLGGWAALTLQQAPGTTAAAPAASPTTPAAPTLPSPTARLLDQPPSAPVVLKLPPLPTLVPAPMNAAAHSGSGVLVSSSAPANTVSQGNAAPVVLAQPQPTLRFVSAPPPPPPPASHSSGSGPAPVTTTHSS